MRKILREYLLKAGVVCFFILSFIAIQFWNDYAPLSVHDRNRKEFSRIKIVDPEDFTFAVFGDNKGNHTFFEPLLKDIRHNKEIAFAVDVGDLVDGGSRGRFRRFLKQVENNLDIPLLSATGNHDFDRGSSDNYQKIFGPIYYAFQAGKSYFIVLDAATEAGFDQTERKWLEEELKQAQTLETRFIFMHVSPFDPRGNGFNKCLPEKDREDLLDLFRRYKVSHLFASHIHGYFSGVWEGVPYTITGGGGGSLQGTGPNHFFYHYVKVHVNDGNVETVVSRIDSEGVVMGFFDLIRDNALDWGLLLGAVVSLFVVPPHMRRRNLLKNQGK